MKISFLFAICLISILSCISKKEEAENGSSIPLAGTWKLVEGVIIEKGDTTVTKYDGNVSFIKIINDTHFAFLQHDLAKGKGKDSIFAAGGGKFILTDSLYTEHLEYCSAREWEGNDFPFTIEIKNDTLIQTGIEKVANLGVERVNTEKYVRVKK
ncbi:hypothetical protein [Dyadobacter arcticus]|uniref:Lipocalin-like domain-containing protein n=1 Tax=Dyadobacter arcticus TaxID=1078754 RepID=A0ABX0UJZ6_9BACT|nr:hypothetical protein [Dyadobacter arcticus]NIJ52798.1 hypothetical protein [Dyadobacter arcticus]